MNWDRESRAKFKNDLYMSLDDANLPRSETKKLVPMTASENGSPRIHSLDSRMTQSTPSTPTLVRKIDNCFGKFDGVSYDLSKLSPIQAFAKISAAKMLTTARVGDPREDPTMAAARPRLSDINRKGFLTVDSQMGKKEVQQNREGGSSFWQRSYVSGVIPRHLAENFQQRMSFEDNVLILVENVGAPPARISNGMTVPLTLAEDYVKLTGDYFPTRAPVTGLQRFEEIVNNVLPEVISIIADPKCLDLIKKDAMKVLVVDMTWGRPFWLFDKVSEVLDLVNDEFYNSFK